MIDISYISLRGLVVITHEKEKKKNPLVHGRRQNVTNNGQIKKEKFHRRHRPGHRRLTAPNAIQSLGSSFSAASRIAETLRVSRIW